MDESYWNLLKLAGITAAVYLGVKYLLPAVIPFFIAGILVRIVLPQAEKIEKKLHVKKVYAGMILLFLLSAILGAGAWFLGSSLWRQICNLAANLDIYAAEAEKLVGRCCRMVEKNTGIHAEEVEQFVYANFRRAQERIRVVTVPDMLKNSISYLITVMKWLGMFLVIFISVILLLKDYDTIREKAEQYPIFQRIRNVTEAMQPLGGAWLKAQIIIILIVAAVCSAGLYLLRYPYALLMGMFLGAADALPFIGTGTILAPWGLFQIFTGQVSYGVCLLVLFVGTNMLREFLEPKLIGDKMGVYPIVMMVTVYLGLRIYGITGVILGPVSYLLIAEIYREMTG